MKAVVLGLSLAGAILAAVLLARGGDAYRTPDGRPVKLAPGEKWAPKAPVDTVLRIAPGTSRREPAAAASSLAPVMRQLHRPGEWRALYERLHAAPRRTPEESYALAEVLERCLAAGIDPPGLREAAQSRAAALSPKDPLRPVRIAAIEWLAARDCPKLDPASAREEAGALLAEAARGGDPKARARLVEMEITAPFRAGGVIRFGDGRRPAITDAQLDALREVARSGDPHAVAIAGELLSSTMANLSIRTGPGEEPVDPRAFHDAWALLACDLGYPCSAADNRRLRSACALHGECDAQDLREHFFFYEHSPRQSQRVAEYHGHLARAVRDGDWSRFQFRREPPPDGFAAWFPSR